MRSIWASVVDERRAERHRVGADRPGDHASGEHRVPDRDGVLVRSEAGRPHRAVAAGVVDRAVGGERPQSVAEAGTEGDAPPRRGPPAR